MGTEYFKSMSKIVVWDEPRQVAGAAAESCAGQGEGAPVYPVGFGGRCPGRCWGAWVAVSEIILIARRIPRSIGLIFRFSNLQSTPAPEETKSEITKASTIFRRKWSCKPATDARIEFSRKGLKSRISNFTVPLFST